MYFSIHHLKKKMERKKNVTNKKKNKKTWLLFPDMHEERKYQFHEHIFLEHHLGQFPDKGPLRRFMELVVLGLSKNPWLTVPEKVEHIEWFVEYFREKQSLLEPTLGDQAKLKDTSLE